MDLGWTWVRSASSFAGVAGILAAFTISAIVLVLSVPPRPHDPALLDASPQARSSQHLFYAFLVALYSLVSSALLFADVTGEVQDVTARSYFTGMFAGTIMAIAVVQLLLAIIWSGAEYAPHMSLKGAKALFTAVGALAAIMVLIDQGDFFSATSRTGAYWLTTYPFLGWAGVLLLFALPLGLGLIARWITWQRHGSDHKANHETAYRVHDAALILSAAVSTLLTAAVSILREENPNDLVTTYTPWMSGAVMALFGLCVFLFIWSLPYEKRPSNTGEWDTVHGSTIPAAQDSRTESAPYPGPADSIITSM